MTAGYGIIEITWNHVRKEWHPHLHVVAFGAYIPQHDLALAWHEVTHGSMIVDIRIIKHANRVSEYVAKYLGKPPDFTDPLQHIPEVHEYAISLQKRHMVIRFGGAPPVPKQHHMPIDDPGDWEPVGQLNQLWFAAKNGDPNAQSALTAALRMPLSTILRAGSPNPRPQPKPPP